jgi:polysaccharide export outer membrane protein
MLRPGDVLRLTVWRRDDLSGEFLVGPDSALIHPLLQEVELVGVPLPEVKSRLEGYLQRYTGEPRTTLEPLFPVYVGGSVRSPALYQLPWGTTVSQAIQEAGGHTDQGRLDRVRFVRGGSDANLDLRSGDALYVASGSSFNVFRDVLQPVAWLMSFTVSILVLANRI